MRKSILLSVAMLLVAGLSFSAVAQEKAKEQPKQEVKQEAKHHKKMHKEGIHEKTEKQDVKK